MLLLSSSLGSFVNHFFIIFDSTADVLLVHTVPSNWNWEVYLSLPNVLVFLIGILPDISKYLSDD
jgi:hypothetical protein